MKMRLKLSPAKWRAFCLGLNVKMLPSRSEQTGVLFAGGLGEMECFGYSSMTTGIQQTGPDFLLWRERKWRHNGSDIRVLFVSYWVFDLNGHAKRAISQNREFIRKMSHIAEFETEWCTVGYVTGALWDSWIRSMRVFRVCSHYWCLIMASSRRNSVEIYGYLSYKIVAVIWQGSEDTRIVIPAMTTRWNALLSYIDW